MIFIGYYEIDSRWLKVKVNYMFIHGNEKVQNANLNWTYKYINDLDLLLWTHQV